MDHALLVGVLESQCCLPGVIASHVNEELPLLIDESGEVLPLDELHDQEVQVTGALGVVGGHDVRVRQPGCRFYLLARTVRRQQDWSSASC